MLFIKHIKQYAVQTLMMIAIFFATTQLHAQKWVDAPAYDKKNAANVLQRSNFFVPLFGATYKEKFEVLINKLPANSVRGVIIYNHGCGGQWGWETTVSQYLYREGFAVITPDFSGREGNKLGCAGASEEESRRNSGDKFREGIYQAVNPARLSARVDDIQAVVTYLKSITTLPIIIGGHSEGCRSTYSVNTADPQIIGGMCVKQGLQDNFEHTWRWNSSIPMWQSLEEFDPWVMYGNNNTSNVGFERKFTANPEKLTIIRVPGKTHDPLNQEAERQSLFRWLNDRVSIPLVRGANGFNYENMLPEIQKKLNSSNQSK
jgi:dienelactone hydrolase